MHVFLTGAGSFIGRAFLKWCDQQNIKVTGVDLTDVGRADCHVGDIRQDSIRDLIPEDVDAIVHLAALSRDPDCRGKAFDCCDSNVMSTLRLMDIAQEKGAKQFVFSSSEWVYSHYPNGEDVTEETLIDITKHKSEYALSKLVTEANLRQRHLQGYIPVTILRFGIVYGPRPSNWCAVEGLLNQVRTKDEITVGSKQTARSFIHVDDIARGIGMSLGKPDFNIYNLQGSKLVTLEDVITSSAQLLKRDVRIIESDSDNPSIRTVSGQKAKEELGFEANISLQDGLQSVIDFLEW